MTINFDVPSVVSREDVGEVIKELADLNFVHGFNIDSSNPDAMILGIVVDDNVNSTHILDMGVIMGIVLESRRRDRDGEEERIEYHDEDSGYGH